MTRAQLDAAYNNRGQVSNWATIRNRCKKSSARLYVIKRIMRSIPNGSHQRQAMGMFFANEPGRPTLVYFHGGYWQWLEKQEEAFVAEGPLSRGVNVVLRDYRLCPSVTFAERVQDVGLAIDALIPQFAGLGAHPATMIVAGSSARPHLAATVLGKVIVRAQC